MKFIDRIKLVLVAFALSLAAGTAHATTIIGADYGGGNFAPKSLDELVGNFTGVDLFFIDHGITVYAEGPLSIHARAIDIRGILDAGSNSLSFFADTSFNLAGSISTTGTLAITNGGTGGTLHMGGSSGSITIVAGPGDGILTGGREDIVTIGGGGLILVDPIKMTLQPVPEPSTILLIGAGISGLAIYRRKKAMAI